MSRDLQFHYRTSHPEFYLTDPNTLLRLVYSVQAIGQQRLRYIDRSRHNEDDNVTALAQGGDVVAYSHKLTQGTSYSQAYINQAVDRLKRAFDAGLLIQAYHFHEDKPGKDEMDFFLEAFEPIEQYTDGVYLPSMIDVEINFGIARNLRQARVGNWLWWVNTEQGKLPMWYSSAYLFGSLLGSDTPWRNSYRKHIASWTSAASPTMPVGVDSEKLFGWQYGVCLQHSWVECPVGVVGATDVNYLMVSLAEAKEMAGSGTLPPPPPVDGLEQRIAALEAWRAEAEGRIDALSLLTASQAKALADISNTLLALKAKDLNLENRVSEAERIFEEIDRILG